jgi:MFS family permease
VLFFVNGTVFFSLPYLYRAIIEELLWTREQTTLFATFQFGTGVIAATASGYLADRLGPSRLLPLAVAFAGTSMVGLSFVDKLWTYYAMAVLLGCSAPAVMVLIKAIVTRALNRNLGLGIGFLMLSSGSAAFVLPSILVSAQSSVSWRGVAFGIGLSIWCLALPCSVLLARKCGSFLASPADGGRELLGRISLLQSRNFILLAVGLILASAVNIGMYQHSALFLEVDLGLAAAIVAIAGTVYGITAFAVRPVMGIAMDHYSFRVIALLYAVLLLAVVWSQWVGSSATTVIWMLMLGLVHGGLVVAAPLLAKHGFAPELRGTVIGSLTSFRQLGFAFGPWLMGSVYDRSGSYDWAFLFWGAACIVSLVAILMVVPAPRVSHRPGYSETH